MTAPDTGAGGMPVAVVGIGCRFPGGITDPAGFWKFLAEGRDAITEIPRSRIDLDHYFDARPATPGHIMTRWGGFLEQLENFDPLFFGISPREAERLDPQQRLILEDGVGSSRGCGSEHRRARRLPDRCVRRPVAERFRVAPVCRPGGCRLLHDDRKRPLCHLRSLVLSPRPARPESNDRHRLLLLARCRAYGSAQYSQRRVHARARGRCQHHTAAAYQRRLFAEPDDGTGWPVQVR